MKKDIRKQMIEKRQSLSLQEKERFDQAIVTSIRKDSRYQMASTVALFYPMSCEIDVRELLKDDKIFLFPKVEGNHIKFYPYQENMRFTKSAFGVYEPDEGKPYEKQIDFMIVPALAIDYACHRIGYGKGFYDRYLYLQRPKTAIGVIYPFQLVDYIEINEHDQVLDGYVKG